ncbi:glutamate--tRNA ligase [Methanobacterium alkalithermotolerans]|uniref:Glutamate--tRNA ligase n=1 Tax=Methanobacterium alkalithermotolerans TaxID=2731220 RepID=A0A8T8KF93_9EURY|nr:glutamate--tRNA ligase [Methanobacterium alkalithermotolerans]QUH23951.1 glutamate--tRNA ligase [Methanobacterium alkalithermotolerans]
MSNMERVVYQHALINAIKHKGKANQGAVIGSIMSSQPDLRKEAKEIAKITRTILDKVNAMDLKQQTLELEKIGGKIEEKKKVEQKGLINLPQPHRGVVLRFAPNPSGPLHIGHARAAVLNSEYVDRYQGKLILRIEDTDPRRVDPDAYQMISEDLSWLGVEYQETFIQSDRIPIYYDYAEKLINKGAAYMCNCPGGEFKKLKDNSLPCPCRDLTVDENLIKWAQMENMAEGEAVLRVKTDIAHKNPAIRDWVAMRVVEEDHPRTGTRYKIYPMMNFSVAVDDHLMGVTHVLRGKDHLANSEKQKYLYDHMGWEVPAFIHYGRLKMDDVALSTSKARQGIEEGKYSGWDDPRLGTIRAIARRGINPQAIHELMQEIGVKISDSIISWKKIYGLNRNILEEKSNRYFFVGDAQEVQIKNVPEEVLGVVERPLHPDFLKRGYRKIPFTGNVYLNADDLEQDQILRLMDAVNVEVRNGKVDYHSHTFEEARALKAQIVQWVPSDSNISTEVVMPDASIIKGWVEPDCDKLTKGDVIQMERFGFARLDKILNDKLIFYYAHP